MTVAEQVVYESTVKEIANRKRLTHWFQWQQMTGTPLYYILPSAKWLSLGRKRQPGIRYITFDDLAELILDETKESYVAIGEEDRHLFFQQFLEEDALGGTHDRHQAKAYADTYGQIKRLGLEVEEYTAGLESLKPLFKRYEQATVNENRLLDPEQKILVAANRLSKRPSLMTGAVVVDGFYDFSPLQYRLITALKKADVPFHVYLPQATFAIAKQTLNDLLSLGFEQKTVHHRNDLMTESISVKAASTTEEQYYGLMQDIILSEKPYDAFGIVLADEKADEAVLFRVAKFLGVPLQRSKRRSARDSAILHWLDYVLRMPSRAATSWEQLPLLELIMKLTFTSGASFALAKKSFLATGDVADEGIGRLIELVRGNVWRKRDTFLAYLHQLERLLDDSELSSLYEQRMRESHETWRAQEIAFELHVMTYLKSLVQEKRQELEEKGLMAFTIRLDLFREWLHYQLERKKFTIEKGRERGVSIHTWRDVPLFQGDKLYVTSMNEGTFPAPHSLQGYVQERDLYSLPIPYGAPTQHVFKMKQEAYFDQLFYIAPEIVFSYIKGMNPNEPFLPSPFLDRYVATETYEWTFEKRMEAPFALTVGEQQEKAAHFLGKGYVINGLSPEIERIHQHVERLKTGEETLSEPLSAQHTLSVTALEQYARCPFRFGMERIFAVKEPMKKDVRVSPLDLGHLIHQVIQHIYEEEDLIGQPFHRLSETDKGRIGQKVETVFLTLWEEVEQRYLSLSRLELELIKREWLKRLRKWWEAERKHFWDHEPVKEMAIYSLERSVSLPIRLPSGTTITLTGKVDRIDVDHEGFTIYDYKTGQAHLKMEEDVPSGLKLQLPLYMIAAGQQLKEKKAYGASYISLKEPEKRANNGLWKPEHVGKGSRFRVSAFCKNRHEQLGTIDFLHAFNLDERIEQLWQGMHEDFSVMPLDCSKSCPYHAVCRVTPEQREEGETSWQ